MDAISAREDESQGLSPPQRRQGAPLDEAPTTASCDPLALERSTQQVPRAPDELEGVEDPGTEEVGRDSALPGPIAGDVASTAAPNESALPADADSLLLEQRTVISKRPPIADLLLGHAQAPHEIGKALIGKQLAHFQLEEYLGGGMGAVFRGRDLTLGRTVAVKVLPRGQDEDTIRRFKNEAQSAARLNHENIARVYYVGEEDGWNFIIFEHIEGPTIRQLVEERGPLPLEEAIHHTLQAAEALDHAYRRDVVHRDIKPSNLIVSTEGVTKLVDMGLARLHQVEASQNDLTASGVTLGTFDYISPEQARDPRNADVRSDLYSLGCTLYFMLTGRTPFPEGTVLQKLLDHQSRQPPDLRVFRPDLPEAAVAVVNQLLAKQPEERHQTPKELIADLLLLLDQLELPRLGPRGAIVAAPAPRRGLFEGQLAWLGPTLLLVLAVFASEWWLRSSGAGGEFALPPIVLPDSEADGVGATARVDHPPSSQAAPSGEGTSPDSATSPRAADASSDRSVTGAPASSENESSEGANDAPGSSSPRATERSASSPAARAPEGRAIPRENASPRTAGPSASPPQDAASSGGSTRIAAEAPPAVVRTIVVGSKVSLPADAIWFATAEEAFRQASLNQWPELETIELRFTGAQTVRPVTLARAHLVIQAGAGHLPVLAFESSAGYALDKHMIRILQGGDLKLDGVQVRWRMPSGALPRDWALFLLDDVRALSLERCVLTLENVDSRGFAQKNGAAFVRLASSTINQRAMQQQPPSPVIPEIYLNQCIVRGEANLVAAAEVEPFELNWSQGLFASTERLIDLRAASLERVGGVTVKLDHVTAVADDGLCRLSSNELAPHQLHLSVVADNCVFATDPLAPLVEHETQNELARLKAQSDWGRLLQWSGSNNARVQGEIAWRIEDAAGAPPVEFRPKDAKWSGLIAAGETFGDYDLSWRNQATWAPQVNDRTLDSYVLDVRRAPEASVEIPGYLSASLPTISRDDTSN